MRALALLVGLAALTCTVPVHAELRLVDESDRAAFRSWFRFLADAQFYRMTPDVTDCAGLVRHAVREAMRPHTPEWVRLARLPLAPAFPDIRHPPAAGPEGWPLFRISDGPRAQYGEFADAKTLIRYNTHLIGRSIPLARPGDLLYFRQADQQAPDHLMVFVGVSMFEPIGNDWVVYHTGRQPPNAGEVRKVRLADLLRHPAPRWRPQTGNASFVGIFRFAVS